MPHRESDNRILDIVDDRLSKRFESYAQAQDTWHKDSHKKLEKMLQDTIKEVVPVIVKETINGKIDANTKATNEAIARLDAKVAPSVTFVDWFIKAGKGSVWVAAAIAAWGGAWLIVKKFFL